MAKKRRKARKSPIQRHHIRYGDRNHSDDWQVELKMWMHKAVTLLARLSPTPENYALVINFQHAVTQIANDHRMALDQGDERHASQILLSPADDQKD